MPGPRTHADADADADEAAHCVNDEPLTEPNPAPAQAKKLTWPAPGHCRPEQPRTATATLTASTTSH
ncbi:hypothetical protein [Nocardia brasiliensis]|uniref:hypothetical protein n=1 Tax=Nocardia brasiliensis TaxID=37326 RepID=UPI0033D67D78